MDHKFGPQLSGTRSHCIARGTTDREVAPQFLHNGWSTGILNCPIDTASASEAFVGGVHDGVYLLVGDVAFHKFKNGVAE